MHPIAVLLVVSAMQRSYNSSYNASKKTWEHPEDASDLEGGRILWGDGDGLQKNAEDYSGVSTASLLCS
jgi:hypothetical protein